MGEKEHKYEEKKSRPKNESAYGQNLKKKKKSAVYKFKNIPPVIFGKDENISETSAKQENITHLSKNSKKSPMPYRSSKVGKSHILTSSSFPAFEDRPTVTFETTGRGENKRSETRGEKIISYCPNCEVEILPNSIRRYRLGYIEFTYPITHIWYLSSYIPLLLNFSRNFIEGISECHESLSSGFPPLSAWAYNGSEPISWTFQNQPFHFPIHLNLPLVKEEEQKNLKKSFNTYRPIHNFL